MLYALSMYERNKITYRELCDELMIFDIFVSNASGF